HRWNKLPANHYRSGLLRWFGWPALRRADGLQRRVHWRWPGELPWASHRNIWAVWWGFRCGRLSFVLLSRYAVMPQHPRGVWDHGPVGIDPVAATRWWATDCPQRPAVPDKRGRRNIPGGGHARRRSSHAH